MIPIEVILLTLRSKLADSFLNEIQLCCNLDLLEEIREQAQIRLTAYQQQLARY